jgi:hypothetical protein
MIGSALTIVAAGMLSVSLATGQSAPKQDLAPTGLLSAVLTFRLNAVESSTPIGACMVAKLMKTPQDFPHAFPMRVQAAFDRRTSICELVAIPVVDLDTSNPQSFTLRSFATEMPSIERTSRLRISQRGGTGR